MEFARYKRFDDFFYALPTEEREIVSVLRDLIQGNFPHWREKMSYGVPYYFGRKRICFIWPASVPPSGLASGVNLGFARGFLLSNEQGLLEMAGRKEVGMAVFQKTGEIPIDTVLEILFEADLIDKEN